jgi:hypothetical protein
MEPWAGRLDELADVNLRASFLGNFVNVLMQAGAQRRALELAPRHLALAAEAGDAGEEVTARMNLSNLHGRRGELEAAVAHASAADALIGETSQGGALREWNRATWGYWLAGLGRFGPALQALETAVAAFQGHASLLAMAQDSLVRVWLTLGQGARAAALVRDQAELPEGRLRARRLATRALVEQALGRPFAGLLEQAIAQTVPSEPVHIVARTLLAAGTIPTQPAEAARELVQQQRVAEAADFLPLATQAAAWRVRALVALGDRAALPTLLAHVEQAALRWRAPNVYLPELMLCCQEGYDFLRSTADARRCLDMAWRWVHAVALPELPPPFVVGFLERQPVNLRLRALVAAPA